MFFFLQDVPLSLITQLNFNVYLKQLKRMGKKSIFVYKTLLSDKNYPTYHK